MSPRGGRVVSILPGVFATLMLLGLPDPVRAALAWHLENPMRNGATICRDGKLEPAAAANTAGRILPKRRRGRGDPCRRGAHFANT
ncbi:MAG: hypothetical protein RML45_08975 [Acetobacteraceae bacterium]|nr:hypothetical protein [Acetobacteraceae bacterium]